MSERSLPDQCGGEGTGTVFYRVFVILVLLLLVLTSGMIAGCTSSSGSTNTQDPKLPTGPGTNTSPVDRVEVIHFHRTQQCPSCIAIGNLAEKTVKTRFRDELASGRLVFAHVGYELPGNASLVSKYGVSGSSLWIGVYNATGFSKEQDTKVWYLIGNEAAFDSHLSEILTKRLNGDLS